MSLATCCVCLELRPLPSTGITRLQQYYGPFRHPRASGLSLTGLRLIIPHHAKGLPVLRALSWCACCRHYPGTATGVYFARFPSRISLPRKGGRVGLCIDLFEVCSAFTQVTACTLAGSPYVTRCIGGFSQFVTSLTAPIASGRSDLAGWGLHPLEKRRLITAHTHTRHSDRSEAAV